MVQETALCTYSLKLTSTRICKVNGLLKHASQMPTQLPCHIVYDYPNMQQLRNEWVPDNTHVNINVLNRHLGPLANWAFWSSPNDELEHRGAELYPLHKDHIGLGELVMQKPPLRGITKHSSSIYDHRYPANMYRLLQNSDYADESDDDDNSDDSQQQQQKSTKNILTIVRQLVERFGDSDKDKDLLSKAKKKQQQQGGDKDEPDVYLVTEDGNMVAVE